MSRFHGSPWLFAFALAAGIAQAQTDERVPQTDEHQEYPNWLRQVHVDGYISPTQIAGRDDRIVAASEPSIAVDSNSCDPRQKTPTVPARNYLRKSLLRYGGAAAGEEEGCRTMGSLSWARRHPGSRKTA